MQRPSITQVKFHPTTKNPCIPLIIFKTNSEYGGTNTSSRREGALQLDPEEIAYNTFSSSQRDFNLRAAVCAISSVRLVYKFSVTGVLWNCNVSFCTPLSDVRRRLTRQKALRRGDLLRQVLMGSHVPSYTRIIEIRTQHFFPLMLHLVNTGPLHEFCRC